MLLQVIVEKFCSFKSFLGHKLSYTVDLASENIGLYTSMVDSR